MDWRCVREVDGGADALVATDSRGVADEAISVEGPALPDVGPAIGQDVGGADSTPVSATPDAAVSTGLDGPEPDRAPVSTSPDSPADTQSGATAEAASDSAADARAPDAPPIGPTVDAPGTCSTDKDCSAQNPLCLGNQCVKCTSDSDCAARSGTPACATASGLCVVCTANRYCKGAAGTCDTTTNQCVGCVTRSDCSGACQTCSNGVCTTVRNQPDPDLCPGTCDSTGACKAKQGQTCQTAADCAGGLPCADGYCCNSACSGSCQACNLATSLGICTTLAANEQPHKGHPTCVATDSGCAGGCQGSAACTYPSSACGTASCTANGSYQAAGTCSNGACAMPTPQACASGKYCTGGACVNLVANGGACQGSGQCASGNCSNTTCCAAGLTGCSGTCVTLSNSNSNCGSCGRSCATGSSCTGGSCYLNDGQACTTGGQCLTGTCSTFYVDGDRDTYGSNAFIQQCGTTIPTGYANRSGDCCDSDPNAKPGQTNTYSVPDACGSFDYNCDGHATLKINLPADGTCGSPLCSFSASRVCQDFGGCTCIGSDGLPTCDTFSTADSCGAQYTESHRYCQQEGPGGCYPFGGNSIPAPTPQECN